MRRRGHQNVGYIDDSLFVAASFLSCWPNVQYTIILMDSFGFTIHPDKSVLMPTQTISFVGFILNLISMTFCLTPEKANNLILCCKELLRLDSFSIMEFAQVIGKLVAGQPGVFHAPLFYKNLEIEKNQQLKVYKGILMPLWF